MSFPNPIEIILLYIDTFATLEDFPHFPGFLEPENELVGRNRLLVDLKSVRFRYYLLVLVSIRKYQNLLPLDGEE